MSFLFDVRLIYSWDYVFSSEGQRNCRTKLSFWPDSPVKTIIHLKSERWECISRGQGTYFFVFQCYVFAKNILVTHFHHNLLVSVFSLKTDVSHRREHISHSICLFCPWCVSPESCVSKGIRNAYIQSWNICNVLPSKLTCKIRFWMCNNWRGGLCVSCLIDR